MVMLLKRTNFENSPPPKETASERKSIRLLVCGDRNWQDCVVILKEIEVIMPKVVIEGEARGADACARIAAQELGIEVIKFPADWNKFGKSAGFRRNIQMLQEGRPDLVLAFHDDLEHSKGTKHMVEIAKKAGIPIRIWVHQERN